MGDGSENTESKASIQLALILGQVQESQRRIELTMGGLVSQLQAVDAAVRTVSNQALELTKWKQTIEQTPPRPRTPSVTSEVISKTSESIQVLAQETAAQTPMLRRSVRNSKWGPIAATLGVFAATFTANAVHSCSPVNAQPIQPPAIAAPAAK